MYFLSSTPRRLLSLGGTLCLLVILATAGGCVDSSAKPPMDVSEGPPRPMPEVAPTVHPLERAPGSKTEIESDVPSDSELPPAAAAIETSAEKSAANAGVKEDKKAERERPTSKQAPGEVIPIVWDDLNINMQQDVVFRPWMLTDRVKDLDGKRVRLTGYMHAGVLQPKNIKEFVLLKNLECKFGPGGQADHLVQVKLQGNTTASYGTAAIQVEGVLKLNPFQGTDGNTWSIYDLLGESVKPAGRK